MAVLLLGEWDKTGLSPETVKTYSAALKFQAKTDIMLVGNSKAMALAVKDAHRLPHLHKVLIVETDNLREPLKTALAKGMAEPTAELMARQAAVYDVFMAATTTKGKNIMPRLAGLLGVAQISDIISVEASDIFRRPIYAGNIIETVRALDTKKVLTVRPSAFPAPQLADRDQGRADKISCPEDLPVLTHFLGEKIDKTDNMPDLSVAKIVVSGGRGFASAENFKNLLEPLALKLHAAIGASRAAVDAGFALNDRQVGQTGRVVSPELYIAIGLSGAPQHLAGMLDSRIIVAINKDAEAPIFQVADYGIVGDLFKVLPDLIQKLS